MLKLKFIKNKETRKKIRKAINGKNLAAFLIVLASLAMVLTTILPYIL